MYPSCSPDYTYTYVLYIDWYLRAVNSYCTEFMALLIDVPQPLVKSSPWRLCDKWGLCFLCWPLLLPCHLCCCCDWWLIQMYCQVNWSELNVKGDLQNEYVQLQQTPLYQANPALQQQTTSHVSLVILSLKQQCRAYQCNVLMSPEGTTVLPFAALKGDISQTKMHFREEL